MKMRVLAGMLVLGNGFTPFANAEVPSHTQATTHDWSGAYVGAHVGYAWGDSDFVDSEYNGVPPFPTVRWDADSDGPLAGLHAGYNWQRGRTVLGIEGEIGRLRLDGAKTQGIDPFGVPYDADGTIDSGWYGGLSARLGYAFDRTLLYAKAGAVYSGAKLGFRDTCTVSPCGNGTINASDKAGWGYQVGGGVEHAVNDRWSIKAEYAYFDFGSTTISGRGVGGVSDGILYDIGADLSVHTLKIGVNYKF